MNNKTKGNVMARGPAYQMVAKFWTHSLKGTGHSWTRLNGSLRSLVNILISGGVAFAERDVRAMQDDFRGSYWFDAESWYAMACEHEHRTAWKSIESYLNRPPFIQDGKRLHVGSNLLWEGLVFRVTSFSKGVIGDDNDQVVAVINNYEGSTAKVERRVLLTRDEIKKDAKAQRSDIVKPTPEMKWLRTFVKGANFCGNVGRHLSRFTSVEDAIKPVVQGDQETIDRIAFLISNVDRDNVTASMAVDIIRDAIAKGKPRD